MEQRGLISPGKGRDPLTILWRLKKITLRTLCSVYCGKYLESDISLDSPRFQQRLGNILAVFMLFRPFLQRNRIQIFLL